MAMAASKQNKVRLGAFDEQLDFLAIDTRFSGFIAGVGAGKTHAGALYTLKKVIDKAGMKGIVATRTYPLLRDVVIATVQDVVPDVIVDDYNKNESIMTFKNGSVIYFRPLETERQIDRIRGYTVNWAWVDEAAYIPYYAIKVLNARLRQGNGQQLAITTTPKGYNWVYKYFEEPKREIPRLREELENVNGSVADEIQARIETLEDRQRNWQAVKNVESSENPFLPPEYLQSLASQYSGDYYAQEVQGKFIKFQGLIYKEFEQNRHVIRHDIVDDMDFRRFFFGYDAGYQHPRVLLKIGETVPDENGQTAYVVVQEFYRVETTVTSAIPTFKEMGADAYEVYADPSAKAEIEEMRDHGLMVESADNAVGAGIQHVKNFFANDRLLISDLCQSTINELMSYQWKGDPDNPTDKPLKEDDHAMDALRYALFSQRGGPIPFATL